MITTMNDKNLNYIEEKIADIRFKKKNTDLNRWK